eukprot:g1854.t1
MRLLAALFLAAAAVPGMADPFAHTFVKYGGKACAGRNELGQSVAGLSLAQAKARCVAEPTCISFEEHRSTGRISFSDSCDTSAMADYANTHDLYVIDRDSGAFVKHGGKACAARNELETQTGITLAQAQAWCFSELSCLSFEEVLGTPGKFQFSTSCDTSSYGSYGTHNLYVINRKRVGGAFVKYSGKACASRNELTTQTGITLVDAKAWCISEPTCTSFEERLNNAGTFQFSTSCDESTDKQMNGVNLYIIKRDSFDVTFAKHDGKACAGRNELGQSVAGLSLAQAKARCLAEPTCISFEENLSTGTISFSDSCDTSAMADYANTHDLYVINRDGATFSKYGDKACASRNELGQKDGLVLEQAKDWCASAPTCMSFEEQLGTPGRFTFSTSCDTSKMGTYAGTRNLYVIDRTPGAPIANTHFAAGDPPACFVDSAGHTVVRYSALHANGFRCTHSGTDHHSTCTCTVAHPDAAKAALGCMEFHHFTGKRHQIHSASCNVAAVKYADTACANRNELETQTGITLDEAKAWCAGKPTCVSFEEKLNNAGRFQFSTTCTPTHAQPFSAHNLYVMRRTPVTFAEVAGKACSGKNELGAQTGLSLDEAKAWCVGQGTCVSFEQIMSNGNPTGQYYFSTSCNESNVDTGDNWANTHNLFVKD